MARKKTDVDEPGTGLESDPLTKALEVEEALCEALYRVEELHAEQARAIVRGEGEEMPEDLLHPGDKVKGRRKVCTGTHLTDAERLAAAKDVAVYHAALARLEGLKKRIASGIKDLVEGYDDRVASLLPAVKSGKLFADVEMLEVIRGKDVIPYRCDTWAKEHSYPATAEDRQEALL